MRRLNCLAAAALVGLLVACDDPNELPDATVPNVVDTLTLNAVRGTPPSTPSGFDIITARPVRLDLTLSFDFIFDFDDALAPVFVPIDLLGLINENQLPPGFIPSDEPFADIDIAPNDGYSQGDSLRFAVDDVFIMRSRLTCSSVGGLPIYGKLHVIDVDEAARQVTLEVLVNENCGYRGLAIGVPGR